MTDLDHVSKWPALSDEMDGAWSLLRHAEEQLAVFRGNHRAEPLLACLSIGAEKLLKLTHGLATTAETGKWPSVQDMRGFGHLVDRLDEACRARITSREDWRPTPYIVGLAQEVESDMLLRSLIAAITSYGDKGRFHNLDTLADQPPAKPSPRDLWQRMENDIIRSRPDLLLIETEDDYEMSRARLNAAMRRSLLGWWELYWRAALNGAFGPQAKRWFSGQDDPRCSQAVTS